jgi:hypothetical protein
MISSTTMAIADVGSVPARQRKLPADCARASPPPGVSTTLTAVCVLGCVLAVLLLTRGEQMLGYLIR